MTEAVSSRAVANLKAARELISNPERHTNHAAARNAAGEGVPYESQEAVCWCAWGAIAKTAPDLLVRGEAVWLLKTYLGNRALQDLFYWNDSHDHSQVLVGFDGAIRMAES